MWFGSSVNCSCFGRVAQILRRRGILFVCGSLQRIQGVLILLEIQFASNDRNTGSFETSLNPLFAWILVCFLLANLSMKLGSLVNIFWLADGCKHPKDVKWSSCAACTVIDYWRFNSLWTLWHSLMRNLTQLDFRLDVFLDSLRGSTFVVRSVREMVDLARRRDMKILTWA